MKMTKPEWRYLQRIALDHPYYDTHKLPMTDAEARAIIEENGVMTGKEFVDSIYAKLGMTRPVRQKKRFDRLCGIGEMLAVPPIRRIAITVLVLVLLTVFFAATPTGRALAESVVQYVVHLFDTDMIISSPDSKATAVEFTQGRTDWLQRIDIHTLKETEQTEYEATCALEQFIDKTGRRPLTLKDAVLIKTLYECSDEEFIVTVYRLENGGRICITQEWDMTDETYFGGQGAIQVSESKDNLYYTVDSINQSITYVLTLDDSVITAFVNDPSDSEKLLSVLMAYSE